MQKLNTVGNNSEHSNIFYTSERIDTLRLRRRIRLLTELCIDCDEGSKCLVGSKIISLHNDHCKDQVGNDFKYCAKCSHTMGNKCPVDQKKLGDSVHQQLAYCTKKRGCSLPFPLIRFDIFFG